MAKHMVKHMVHLQNVFKPEPCQNKMVENEDGANIY